MAGYLWVPLYSISRNDSRLADQLFAQLLSPAGLPHDNTVIQIDEFQDSLKRWPAPGSHEQGVSIGGLREVLQGSTSLARGFIILSGTQGLVEPMQELAFAAVFRRIAVATPLSWLSHDDARTSC